MHARAGVGRQTKGSDKPLTFAVQLVALGP